MTLGEIKSWRARDEAIAAKDAETCLGMLYRHVFPQTSYRKYLTPLEDYLRLMQLLTDVNDTAWGDAADLAWDKLSDTELVEIELILVGRDYHGDGERSGHA